MVTVVNVLASVDHFGLNGLQFDIYWHIGSSAEGQKEWRRSCHYILGRVVRELEYWQDDIPILYVLFHEHSENVLCVCMHNFGFTISLLVVWRYNSDLKIQDLGRAFTT